MRVGFELSSETVSWIELKIGGNLRSYLFYNISKFQPNRLSGSEVIQVLVSKKLKFCEFPYMVGAVTISGFVVANQS